MQNSLHQSWKDSAPQPGWSIDAAPRARLVILFAVFAVPVLLVAMRLVWLQVVIPERFLAAWTETRETFESIPASDGRILAQDGTVLAFDQPSYSIAVHYRWLEEPVDPGWLKARARELLPKEERRNPERLNAAQARILSQREDLWRSLSELTGHSLEDLSERRAAVQSRIERLAQEAEDRRANRRSKPVSAGDTTLWNRLWRELSTPPERDTQDPIIVREEKEAHSILEQVPIDQIATIEAQPSRFPGVEIRSTCERVYPQGALAPHLIGWRSAVDQVEIERRQVRFPSGDPLALEAGDRFGRTGIERSYDGQIRGLRGLKRVVRNYASEVVETEVVRTARPGADVTLTIDAALQKQAEELLDAVIEQQSNDDAQKPTAGEPPFGEVPAVTPRAGSVIVLDLQSGETLIAASSPRFDLSAIRQQWKTWNDDPRRPFVSRVTQATVPPGSVFKVVTAIAGLETGLLSPDDLFHCQGYLNEPQHDRCSIFRTSGIGHGDLDLDAALAQSCNVYFFDLAQRMGPQPIEIWARRLGFGTPTGIDLGGERSGHVPSRTPSNRSVRWYPGTTRQLAIGQADLTVTPLQVAKLMAILGNGGHEVTPHVTRPLSSDSSEIQLASARSTESLLSQRTLTAVHEGLELTVASERGTGHAAEVPGVPIAGKTGTAEVSSQQPAHAWFAGYVPADQPRYAITVYLEHGGAGGKAAAPLARQIILSMIEADLLKIGSDAE
jgi:penicillin-binding protein 2